MKQGLEALLNPDSIALLGASAQPGKAGHTILGRLLAGGFHPYLVNPRGDSIQGIPIYGSLGELPEVPDLAILAVPAEATPAAAAECAGMGVGAVIAVAGGFGEAGEAGRELEQQLGQAIHGSPTRLLGPNTLGVMVPRIGLDTVFLPADRFPRPRAGGIALVSQSGSAVVGELGAAAQHGVGISAFVGLGNRLDLDETELLAHFSSDRESSVIALYLESFRDPDAFLKLAAQVSREKPLVMIRAGRSEAGSRAVQLHTGALAGSDRVTDGALRQAGILRAYDAEEFLDAARALAATRPLQGRRIAVLTNGGGWGVLAADYIESTSRGIGAQLASWAPETERRLRGAALPFASLANPIDLTASATTEMVESTLEILQDDPGIDAVLCCVGYQPPTLDPRGLTEAMVRWGRDGRKPLVAAVSGSEAALEAMRGLEGSGVAAFPSLWRAVRALDFLARRGDQIRRRETVSPARHLPAKSALPAPGVPLAEDEVKALLRRRGIAVPDSKLLPRGELPGDVSLPWPVVLKVRSATILHKSDLGGVALGIRSREELDAALRAMRERFPGEDLLVEQMEAPGVEMIVGLVDDPTFGPSIMCGTGGVMAELYRDVAFRRLPISRNDAEEMLSELRAGALLEGFRGIRADRGALVELMLRVSDLGMELAGELEQMDLNPVIVHGDGAVVVDAKLVWKHQGS